MTAGVNDTIGAAMFSPVLSIAKMRHFRAHFMVQVSPSCLGMSFCVGDLGDAPIGHGFGGDGLRVLFNFDAQDLSIEYMGTAIWTARHIFSFASFDVRARL